MRGKCDTCEFFKLIFGIERGTCHIRSVASNDWPERQQNDRCGEYSLDRTLLEPPEDLPEVHSADRVEKSMREPSNAALDFYACPSCGHMQKFTGGTVTRQCAGCKAQIKWFCDMRHGYDRVFGWSLR